MDFTLPLSRSICSAHDEAFCETLWLRHVNGRLETFCDVDERQFAALRRSHAPDHYVSAHVRAAANARCHRIAF